MVAGIVEQLLAAMGEWRGIGAADRLYEAVSGCWASMLRQCRWCSLVGTSGPWEQAVPRYGGTTKPNSPSARDHVWTPWHGMRRSAWGISPIPPRPAGQAYGPAMLADRIRGVYAVPILVAGQYVGASDLYRVEPTMLAHDQVAGVTVAAELLQIPMQGCSVLGAEPGSDVVGGRTEGYERCPSVGSVLGIFACPSAFSLEPGRSRCR